MMLQVCWWWCQVGMLLLLPCVCVGPRLMLPPRDTLRHGPLPQPVVNSTTITASLFLFFISWVIKDAHWGLHGRRRQSKGIYCTVRWWQEVTATRWCRQLTSGLMLGTLFPSSGCSSLWPQLEEVGGPIRSLTLPHTALSSCFFIRFLPHDLFYHSLFSG